MSENVNANSQKDVNKSIGLAAVAILASSVAYWFMRFQTISILPTIAGDLDGMAYYTWASMLFMLLAAIMAPLWGKFSDLFGRKLILSILLVIMIAGNVVCSLATNIYIYIAGYAVCGFGAGGMQGTYFALMGDLFPPDKRGKYGGMILMLMSTTQLLLPLAAAAITQFSSWRYVFYLTIAVCIATLIMVIAFIPKIESTAKNRKIDYIGTLFLACAVTPLLLALSWGGSKYPWTSPTIVIMLLVSVVMFLVVYFYEKKIPEYAVISVKLLSNKSFVFSCLVSVFMAFSMSVVSTYLPLFVQGLSGMSATVYSAAVMPASIVAIFTGGIAGWLMDKTKRYKWLLVMAPTSALIVCVVYGMVPMTVPVVFLVAVRVFQQVFGASFMPSINPLAAMAQIEPEDFGAGTGTLNFLTNMGNAFAPALLGSVFNAAYAKNIATHTATLASPLDQAQAKMIATARVLTNPASMKTLGESFGSNTALYDQTVEAVRLSLYSSIKAAYFVAAALICISIFSAIMVKEVPLDQIQYKKPGGASKAKSESSKA